jgi:hypothetical protein
MKSVFAFMAIAILAVASPALAVPFKVTPRTLAFGKIIPGGSKTFTVRSGHRPPLSISVHSSSPSFPVTPAQALVGPGRPQVFTVTFTPTGLCGPNSGKISVTGGGATINVVVHSNAAECGTPTPTPSPTPTATPTVVGEPSPTPTLPMITPVPPSASPVSQSGGLLNLFRQIW